MVYNVRKVAAILLTERGITQKAANSCLLCLLPHSGYIKRYSLLTAAIILVHYFDEYLIVCRTIKHAHLIAFVFICYFFRKLRTVFQVVAHAFGKRRKRKVCNLVRFFKVWQHYIKATVQVVWLGAYAIFIRFHFTQAKHSEFVIRLAVQHFHKYFGIANI